MGRKMFSYIHIRRGQTKVLNLSGVFLSSSAYSHRLFIPSRRFGCPTQSFEMESLGWGGEVVIFEKDPLAKHYSFLSFLNARRN